MNILLSIYIWIMCMTVTAFTCCGMVFWRLFHYKDKLCASTNIVGFWWGTTILKMNPFWTVEIKGAENIPGDETRIYVSNHASLADIVIISMARKQFKWVAKDSLFRIPFLGWAMSLSKHIRLKREDMASIKKVNRQIADMLDNNMSVLIFAEGTRSRTGALQPFKNGAFKIAIQKKVPIIPIAVKGTFKALPRASWIFSNKVQMKVIIFPPIDTSGYEMRQFGELRDKVHSIIENELAS